MTKIFINLNFKNLFSEVVLKKGFGISHLRFEIIQNYKLYEICNKNLSNLTCKNLCIKKDEKKY